MKEMTYFQRTKAYLEYYQKLLKVSITSLEKKTMRASSKRLKSIDTCIKVMSRPSGNEEIKPITHDVKRYNRIVDQSSKFVCSFTVKPKFIKNVSLKKWHQYDEVKYS